MKRIDDPFEGLDIKYPRAKFGDGSIKQKAFFEHGSYESGLIPFEDRIKVLATFVFEGYDLHQLVENYLEDKDALEDYTRKYCIASTFKAYADKIFFEPETGDWREAAVKLLIGDESKTSSEQMQEAIDTFVEVVNVHLKKEMYVKPPKVPVYLLRAIFKEKDAYNADKITNNLYEDNIVCINIKDKNSSDEAYIRISSEGHAECEKDAPKYIRQFCELSKLLKNKDVMVIAYYKYKNPKIGLIKKGSKVFRKEEANEIYILYCLRMENVQCISDKRKKILDTVIPAGNTVTPVIKRADVIYSVYYELPLPVELTSLTDSNLEKMCAEYLRSYYKFKSVKVLGENYPNIDIFGYNAQNELFVAQVSSAESSATIDKKIEKLMNPQSPFENVKHEIMFSTRTSTKNGDYENINIKDVWDYFANDESRKEFLKTLIEL